MHCFRCLGFGHTRQRCTSAEKPPVLLQVWRPVAPGTGMQGSGAGFPLCAASGRPAQHKMGRRACPRLPSVGSDGGGRGIVESYFPPPPLPASVTEAGSPLQEAVSPSSEGKAMEVEQDPLSKRKRESKDQPEPGLNEKGAPPPA